MTDHLNLITRTKYLRHESSECRNAAKLRVFRPELFAAAGCSAVQFRCLEGVQPSFCCSVSIALFFIVLCFITRHHKQPISPPVQQYHSAHRSMLWLLAYQCRYPEASQQKKQQPKMMKKRRSSGGLRVEMIEHFPAEGE